MTNKIAVNLVFSATVVSAAIIVLRADVAAAEISCTAELHVECEKDLPADFCDFLTQATPEAFSSASKSGGSFCAMLASPEVTFLYSPKGLTLRIPLTPEVGQVFGLTETRFRRVKGKNLAFNVRDPRNAARDKAIDQNNMAVAYQNSPFHYMFNRLFTRFATLEGHLAFQAGRAGRDFADRLSNVTTPTRIVFTSGDAIFTSVSLGFDSDDRGIDAVTLNGRTIRRDDKIFPSAFEGATKLIFAPSE